MQLNIRPARPAELEDVARLYDELNDHLDAGTNFPGWQKGVYPTLDTARAGLAEGALYLAFCGDELAGAAVLNQTQPSAYRTACWHIPASRREVLAVHTLAVHPRWMGRGVARELLEYAERLAARKGAKAIRLDTFQNNLPAIALYRSCGFALAGKVDLGYADSGRPWFFCFEKAVQADGANE